jgi:hypothetical protein
LPGLKDEGRRHSRARQWYFEEACFRKKTLPKNRTFLQGITKHINQLDVMKNPADRTPMSFCSAYKMGGLSFGHPVDGNESCV